MLAELEAFWRIITQNVDDLHERAGLQCSSFTWRAFKSVQGIQITFLIERRFDFGDVDLENNQLRPHIVWFWRRSPCAKVALISLQLTICGDWHRCKYILQLVYLISRKWNALFYINPKLPIKIPNLRNTLIPELASWKEWKIEKQLLELTLKLISNLLL
jgi:NAD-dependent deacetylase